MFSFGIEESWRAVQHILEHRADAGCTRGVRVLRDMWEKNKKPLYTQSAGTGRWTTEVEYCGNSAPCATHVPAMLCASRHIDEKIADYRTNLIARNILHDSMGACTIEEVADNKLYTKHTILIGDYEYTAPLGMRLGKFVRGYAKESFMACGITENEFVDIVVMAASRATEMLRVAPGITVVLSVNPLDMLLASNCTTSWTSCHSMKGRYATGPLSYMVDTCTAIAYAYSDTKKYRGLMLPRKMWRQMVHFDLEHGSALMLREYPSQHQTSAVGARKLVTSVLAAHHGIAPKILVSYLTSPGRVSTDTTSDYTCNACPQWAYPDAPTVRVRLESGSAPHVQPGSAAIPCVVCGDLRYAGAPDCLEGSCCGGYSGYTCIECGERLSSAEVRTSLNNDEHYCETCYDNIFVECSYCGAEICRSESRYQGGRQYCQRCYTNLFVTCDSCRTAVSVDYVRTCGGRRYCWACLKNVTWEITCV